MRLLNLSVPVLLCAVTLTGCVQESNPPEPPQPPVLTATTALPGEFLTVAADTDPAANAIMTSAALYDRAQLVVTAPAGDHDAQLLAGSAAVSLGAPLLLLPEPGSDGSGSDEPGGDGSGSDGSGNALAALEQELARLATTTVLSIGGEDAGGTGSTDDPPDGDAADGGAVDDSDAGTGDGAPQWLRVDATVDAIAAVLPGTFDVTEVASEDAAVSAMAGLDATSAVLLRAGPESESGTEPEPESDATPDPTATAAAPGAPASESSAPKPPIDLSRVERPEPLVGGVMLATNEPAQLAGVATARAAGVEVYVVPADRPNPQTSAELVTALSDAEPAAAIALGAPFAAESSLDWKVRSSVAGVQLPGGGLRLFPAHQLIALYGTPGAPVLGVLGEQGTAETIARAQQTAAPYADLTDRTVVPTLEIIATVAAGDAGADGNYSNEIAVETLQPLVDAAGEAGLYVVLDLQPGRTDFLTQAKRYESLLTLPHVGLALDPEWRLQPDQRHLVQIGSVEAAEVNSVVTWLADLTAERSLPQKLLVLHQFQSRMIQNRAAVDMSRDELAMLIHVDGQGSQPAKQETWRVLQQDAPAGIAWGWKNFYDEDLPPLTPEQTMTQVSPVPDLVTYQ